MSKLKKMLILATLSSLAAVLSIFESMLPILPAIPGGKLGIANSVAVFVMYIFGGFSAITVSVIRTVISSLFYGGMNAFMYSFAGALFSTLVMIVAHKTLKNRISPIGISVLGAACHNTAQVAVAYLVLRSSALVWYLAVLILISVVSGTACGYCTEECLKRIKD